MSKLAVVIVSFNTKDLSRRCLQTVFDSNTRDFEVWVVDNGSSDGSVEMIKKNFPKVKLIESNMNLGFSRGNNLALEQVKADYYLLLNSDTELSEDAISKLVAFIEENELGVVSCKLINPDGTFQPNGGLLPTVVPLSLWLSGADDVLAMLGIRVGSYHIQSEKGMSQRVGWVAGAVMLIRKEVIEKIGLLDEKIFMYGEDVDFCWRANGAGFKVGWTNSTSIIHLGGASSKNPRINQWLGEFKGLIYLYNKYYGSWQAGVLSLAIKFFTVLRMVVFLLIGKLEFSKSYAKVITSI